MKKVLVLIVMMTFTGALNAQGLKGLLNKAKEKIEKVSNDIDKTVNTITGTDQSSTQSNPPQSQSASTDDVRNIDGLPVVMKDFETEDPRDLTPYIEKYATHKKTANTKTITVDELSGGLLDRSGNIVKAGVTGCFVNGLAPVYDDDTDEIGYVNMNGEWIIKFERSEF